MQGVTALSLRSDGVALARICRPDSDAPPHLDICRFYPLDTPASRPELLQTLSREHDLDRAHCISVAEPGSFTLLLVEAPEVDNTELRAAVRWRIKDLIDFHIDDAVIDVFDIPGQQERGRQKMMYVVASRINTVREHIDLLEENNVGLEVIDIPELALRNIAAMIPEDESGMALLHLGSEGSLLTLTRQRTLYLSRTMDISLSQLSLAAEPESTPGETADDEITLSPADESGLPLALQRQLDAVILEIQRSLDYYESHFSLPPVSGLVIAPLELPVPGLMGYLASHLGVPVRMLDLDSLLESDTPLPENQQGQCLLAIGAALRQEEKTL